MKTTFILIFILFISSCTSVSYHRPLADNEEWNSNDTALIIGSCSELAEEEFPRESYCRFNMDDNSKYSHGIQIGANGPFKGNYSVDVSDSNKKRKVFLIPIPEGEWYFSAWGVMDGPYWYNYWVGDLRSKNLMKLNVKKGEAVYIGDIGLKLHYRNEPSSLEQTKGISGTIATVNDNYELDLKLLNKKYPFLKEVIVRKHILPVDHLDVNRYKNIRNTTIATIIHTFIVPN
jgi:hypothetical protein